MPASTGSSSPRGEEKTKRGTGTPARAWQDSIGFNGLFVPSDSQSTTRREDAPSPFRTGRSARATVESSRVPRPPARFFLVDYGLLPFVFNVLLNAGIAWLFFMSLSSVPLWGPQSIAGDTIITCFLLPCIACLICTPLIRGETRRGRIPRNDVPAGPGHWIARFTASAKKRSVLFGLIGLALAAPLSIAALTLSGVDAMSLTTFVWFKGLFAGTLAAVFVPWIAAAALHDAPR